MRIRLLGPLEVVTDQGPANLAGPKERTVLAILALHAGDLVSSDLLIDAVWGDDPPRTAARTLQAYVSRLRRTLGTPDSEVRIESGHGGYRLVMPSADVDVVQAESLIAQAWEAAGRGDHTDAALTFGHALELWRGRPLGDLADESWAAPSVSRLAELRAQALEGRIDAELAAGRDAVLTGELEALCTEFPFRERFWAQRILALYRAGRQAEALEVYQELRGALVTELGIDPSPELQRLHHAVLTQDPSLDLANGEAGTVRIRFPRSLAAVDGWFVGRERELADLEGWWSRAEEGSTRGVMVGGEPGIGKTQLLREFAGRVAEREAVVLYGSSDEELAPTYQPFAEALRGLVEAAPIDLLRNHVRRHGGDLMRLVPALVDRLSDVPEPSHAESESERYRLFESVEGLLAATAERNRVLLVLDDLQWATKPTLLMLRHLMKRSIPGSLIVCCYRDTEVSEDLAALLADLRPMPRVARAVLKGLDEDAVAHYLADRVGDDLDEDGRAFARRLATETGGSPFFVSEVVHHLSETGVIGGGRGWSALLEAGSIELPASIHEVVSRRLRALPELGRRVLSLASVVGPSFSLSMLEHLEPTADPDDLLEVVEQAVEAGMLREPAGRIGTYAFSHELVRQALYGGLSALRRARLHRRVAEALEARPGADERTFEIAQHYLAGAADGVSAKAVSFAVTAAAEAKDRLAFEEAIRICEEGLEIVEWTGDEASAPACDLLLELGDSLWKAGDPLASRQAYDRAAVVARSISDAERSARAALRSSADLGGWAQSLSSNDDHIALLEEALGALRDGSKALRARLLARLAVELYWVSDAASRRRQLAADAVDEAVALEDRRVLLYTLVCRQWATLSPTEPIEERLVSAEVILRLAEALDDDEVVYQARFLRVAAFLEAGDFEGADAEAAEGARVADRLRIPGFLPWVPAYRALRAWIVGRIDEAQQLNVENLTEALERPLDPDLVFALIGGQSLLFRYLRPLEETREAIEAVRAENAHLTSLQAALCLVYRLLDQPEECRRQLDVVLELDWSPDVSYLVTTGMLVQPAIYVGDRELAERLYRELMPYADRWIGTLLFTWGPVSLALGRLAAFIGDPEAALAHLERGMSECDAAGARIFAAECRLACAQALAGDDPALADAMVADAMTTARELDLPTLEAWCESASASK